RTRPPVPSMACPKPPPTCRPPVRSCLWTASGPDSRLYFLRKSTPMADETINFQAGAEPDAPSTPPQYHAMVLLVDDQAMVFEAVRRALANQPDIDFHYCPDAREALALANQIKPTVILQDLVMPGIDGLTLVSQYRANPTTRDTPIIVLSTNENPQVKGQAFALGANDYLVKLPDKIELIARIRYHSKALMNLLQRDA